jgi:hypothetical protein
MQEEDFKKILTDPATWLYGFGVAAFVGAWWANPTPFRTNLTLFLGVVAFTVGTYFHQRLSGEPWLLKVLWSLAVLSVSSLLVYYVGWQAQPSEEQPNAITREELGDIIKGLGDAVNRERLLQRFALGYIIFDVSYRNVVVPYDTQVLDQYEVDWRVVRLTENTKERIQIQLPDFWRKGQPKRFTEVKIGGPRAAWDLEQGVALGEVMALGRVLAVRDNGIVFLVGFDHAPKNVYKPE